ncbi:MAG: hypothetical protein ACO1RX_12155 [Candidatus Sericytochromatia bacterium]
MSITLEWQAYSPDHDAYPLVLRTQNTSLLDEDLVLRLEVEAHFLKAAPYVREHLVFGMTAAKYCVAPPQTHVTAEIPVVMKNHKESVWVDAQQVDGFNYPGGCLALGLSVVVIHRGQELVREKVSPQNLKPRRERAANSDAVKELPLPAYDLKPQESPSKAPVLTSAHILYLIFCPLALLIIFGVWSFEPEAVFMNVWSLLSMFYLLGLVPIVPLLRKQVKRQHFANAFEITPLPPPIMTAEQPLSLANLVTGQSKRSAPNLTLQVVVIQQEHYPYLVDYGDPHYRDKSRIGWEKNPALSTLINGGHLISAYTHTNGHQYGEYAHSHDVKEVLVYTQTLPLLKAGQNLAEAFPGTWNVALCSQHLDPSVQVSEYVGVSSEWRLRLISANQEETEIALGPYLGPHR